MLLMQDRVLGETMMHLVPNCFPQPPTFDASQLDFDLDLLPGLTDCQVPSPSDSLDYPISPTMFSPDQNKDDRRYSDSPASSISPSSPYTPESRMERKISTTSTGLQEVDMSHVNLQESLLEFTQLQDRIKKEQDMALSLDSGLTSPFPYPGPNQSYQVIHTASTYPDSSSDVVKMEPLEFLEDSLLSPASSSSHTVTSQTSQQSTPDSGNLLLKQRLQDRSFETKYNLKPFDFGGTTGFVSERSKTDVQRSEQKKEEGKVDVKIEPVLDLAVEQVKKDIETTCGILAISSDPKKWKETDVRCWLLWTLQQFSLPMSMLDLDLWNMTGQTMVGLSEAEFRHRLPQGADTVYAQFDMWRTNASYHYPTEDCSTAHRYAPPPYPDYSWGPAEGSSSPMEAPITLEDSNTTEQDTSFSDIAYMLQMLDNQNNPVGDPQTHYITPKTEPCYSPHQASPPPYPGTADVQSHSPGQASSDFGVDPMEEEEDDEEDELDTAQKSPSRPGTSIHLWQFVKELLLQPSLYSNYIHWIDRQKGIFKIVDSVKVATLWGKRKNRPAMNYDKLSRSLRQYYKKGIMKKTERSQRLVYQFCHPYHL